jgi:hypothetical protein
MMDWRGILMQDLELSEQFEKDGLPLSEHSGKQGGHLIPAPNIGEKPEFHIEKVKCQVCFEVIGKILMEDFEVPMRGFMFRSKDSKHGYPRPFPRDFTWEDLRCPICNKRPFYNENYFVNEKNEKCGLTEVCEDCGKYFKNKLSLYGHKGQVHKEK